MSHPHLPEKHLVDSLEARNSILAADPERLWALPGQVLRMRLFEGQTQLTCRGTGTPAKASPPYTSLPWHLLLVGCHPAGLL